MTAIDFETYVFAPNVVAQAREIIRSEGVDEARLSRARYLNGPETHRTNVARQWQNIVLELFPELA